MSSPSKIIFTPDEYLELERNTDAKSEYFKGEIFGMAGVSPQHVLIVTNVVGELCSQLKNRPFNIYSSALRLKISRVDLYTYPDVMVVNGESEYSDNYCDTLTNPTLIVEVLSKSTGDYDRGEKFEMYRTLPSFKEYLVIADDRFHIEHSTHQPNNTWVLSETNRLDDKIE